MRNREDIVLSHQPASDAAAPPAPRHRGIALGILGAVFCCGLLSGCGQSASGEYRDFPSAAEAETDDLPIITPGDSTADSDTTNSGDAEQPADQVAAVTDTADQTTDTSDTDTTETVGDTQPKTTVADADPTEPTTTDGQPTPVDGQSTVQEEPGTRDEIVSEAREIKLLIPSKDFTKDKATGAIRVSYDDIDLLKILNMEPVPANAVDRFPGWLKQLNGERVRIRGYMYPTYQATGLTAFLIARDNGICCFVRQPKVYDIISVKLADGQTSDYIEGRPFDVVGTFHIDPYIDEDELLQLYRIDNARVIAD